MNSVIINTLRKRSDLIQSGSRSRSDRQGNNDKGQNRGQSQNGVQSESQGHNQNVKNSERQIFVTLLLITFTFLLLNIPPYSFFLYVMLYNYEASPKSFANYVLYESIARNLYFTNYGINFFLYVISGRKFRSDLRRLFRCHSETTEASSFETKVFTLQMSNDSKEHSELK